MATSRVAAGNTRNRAGAGAPAPHSLAGFPRSRPQGSGEENELVRWSARAPPHYGAVRGSPADFLMGERAVNIRASLGIPDPHPHPERRGALENQGVRLSEYGYRMIVGVPR